jgi:NAD+ kinase
VTTVALLVHPARADALALARETVSWLTIEGHRARLLLLGEGEVVDEEGRTAHLDDVDLTGVDLAVGLGGDGTFLRLVAPAWAAGIPSMGVNFGRLGYLLELRPEELRPTLARALKGDMVLEERTALSVTVEGDGEWFALNEVVLEKTVFGHTVRLDTAIDGEDFLTYSADGLLIATPTGSTAYNLSAGGPVVSPTMRAMVMTPVAPHLALDRSLVLHPDQVVSVRVLGRPVALVIDGREAGRLPPGTVVTCRVAAEPVRMVNTGERSFGGLLRVALGLDPKR